MNEPLFNINGKNSQAFEEEDTFNHNILKGFINRGGHSKYGLMFISHVNGRECPQYVWGTPKMSYPFDNQDRWVRIDNINKIEVWEKIDGTNILGFTYHDADGNIFVSYKTRLRPTLGENKFGNFRSLWGEMLKKYPQTPETILKNKCNISFEMYGKRNKILVEYDTPLDCAVLFGVLPEKIITPTMLDLNNLPSVKLIKSFETKIEFVKEYEEIRKYLNENISKGEDDVVRGIEGTVFYVVSSGVVQYKCKPDIVLEVHWAEKGIPRHSIYTTVLNAYEETDTPDFELIKSLLLEEFEENEIIKREEMIKKIMVEVAFEKKFKVEIRDKYINKGLNIAKDKSTCMRYFAGEYNKKMANKIFTFLWNEFGSKTK